MKRKIEFRGQDVLSDVWYYGDLEYGRNDIPFAKIHTYNEDGSYYHSYLVDADTVGEFTGLHDKHGRAIYEGDILYSEFIDTSGGYSLVGWNDKTSSFGIMDEYSYRSIFEGYDFAEFKNYVMLAHLRDAIICEVCGNVFDNPNLLKAK